MENQELMKELGVIPSQRIKTLVVDNGDNIKGDNATGEFVIKVKEDDKIKREKYGNELKAIVLKVRSKLTSKYKQGVTGWYSTEFNSIDTEAPILIKRGKERVGVFTYRQIKDKFKIQEADGSFKNNFNYITILYLQLENGEIVRLKLTGKSQGNWFNFHATCGATTLAFVTEMKIIKGENGYYEATFKKGEKSNISENLEVAKTLPDYSYQQSKQLIGQETPQIEAPTVEEPVQTEAQIEEPRNATLEEIQEIAQEVPDPEEEISVEDIPF